VEVKFTPAFINDANGAVVPNPAADSGSTLFSALQEQLGLRLEGRRGPVEVLVIEKVSRPTEN